MHAIICEDCQEVRTVRRVGLARCTNCGSRILSSVEGYETADAAER